MCSHACFCGGKSTKTKDVGETTIWQSFGKERFYFSTPYMAEKIMCLQEHQQHVLGAFSL
jgi:hypothetical protein